ncbi:hypothetical protein [Bacillus thuringiensis]|uniref:hypothetical protein n=1 Tax=Bacillus thuringiensis TaxID=1428 RepID=UPI0010656D55|nr:hypothetical protein [Bacillus thuringiensis]
MSKAGVVKTQGYRKTRERADFGERVINGVVAVGKVCTKCGEWKDIDKCFSKKKGGLGGKRAVCTACEAEVSRRYHIENKEKIVEYHRKRYKENQDRISENNRRWEGNNKERRLEYLRGYRKKNRHKLNEQMRKFRSKNPERYKLALHRRLARKKSLVDDFTPEKMRDVLNHFNSSCSLTGNQNSHWDHVIPLATGHGGTTYGNMVPLRRDLNESKGSKNIFEWFEANRQRFELSQSKFDSLIKYLADANEMTVEDYQGYVYWCHENPRILEGLETESEVIS